VSSRVQQLAAATAGRPGGGARSIDVRVEADLAPGGDRPPTDCHPRARSGGLEVRASRPSCGQAAAASSLAARRRPSAAAARCFVRTISASPGAGEQRAGIQRAQLVVHGRVGCDLVLRPDEHRRHPCAGPRRRCGGARRAPRPADGRGRHPPRMEPLVGRVARSGSARAAAAAAHASARPRKQYRQGRSPSSTLLQAQRDPSAPTSSRIQADADLVNARAQLRVFRGTDPPLGRCTERNAMNQAFKLLAPALLALAPACRSGRRPADPGATAAASGAGLWHGRREEVPRLSRSDRQERRPEVVSIQPQVPDASPGLHFKDGATVKRGDLLVTIDPRPYQASSTRPSRLVGQPGRAGAGQASSFGRVRASSRGLISQPRTTTRARAPSPCPEAQVRLSKAAVDTAKLKPRLLLHPSPIDGAPASGWWTWQRGQPRPRDREFW